MSTLTAILTRPARTSPPRRDDRARSTLLAAPAACAVGAWTAVVAPFALVGLAGAAAAVAAFAVVPGFALLAVVLVRPSLDTSEAFFSVGGANLAGLLGAAVVLGGGVALCVGRRAKPTAFSVFYGAFLLVGGLTLLWSLEPGEGARTLVSLTVPLVLFAVAARIVQTERDVDRLIGFTLASACVPLLVGAVQLATGQLIDKHNGFLAVNATFVHANGYGLYLVVVIALGAAALTRTRAPGGHLALGVLVVAAVASLGLTYARVAWVAVAIAILVLAVVHARRLVPLAVVAVLTVVVALPSIVGTIERRFSDLSGAQASSLTWRGDVIERMLPYGQDAPALGNGLGSYLPLSNVEFGFFDAEFQGSGAARGRNVVFAHNDYLHFFVEIGLVGVILWIAALVSLGVGVLRLRRLPGVGVYATVVGTLVLLLLPVGLTETAHSQGSVLLVLAVLAGALHGVAGTRRRAGEARVASVGAR